MTAFRHRALDVFLSRPMPRWGDTELLAGIDFDDVRITFPEFMEKQILKKITSKVAQTAKTGSSSRRTRHRPEAGC